MNADQLPETTLQSPKSGQEVAKQEPTQTESQTVQGAPEGRARPIRTFPKTHKEYWRQRLERRCYTRDGKLIEVNEWSVRIQHLGERRGVALGTSNAEDAAVKARDIYVKILAEGWEAAEATFNPEMVMRKDDPTVGQFLEEVEKRSELKPKTFRNYAGYFRRIVADTFNMEAPKEKFDYRSGGHQKWIERVDAVKLAAITPDKIADWKAEFIKAAGKNPLDRASAIRSANSYVRCARALFSRKWLDLLRVRMPDPLPFHNVKVEKYRPPRYRRTIDPQIMFAAAQAELGKSNPGAYLVFLLGLGAGLRKAEIDGLEWRHINFDRATITVEPTAFRDLKTEESAGEVQIDPVLAREIRRCKPATTSVFVIPSHLPPRVDLAWQYYRAEPVFKQLYTWLRSKGVTARCPLHVLRKEFGSQINKHFGLYAAMTALRHANISTTSDHYTDNKQRTGDGSQSVQLLPQPDYKPITVRSGATCLKWAMFSVWISEQPLRRAV